LPSTGFDSASAVRAFQDLKYISAVGSRGTGSAGDKRAIDYVSRNFRKSGLEVRFDEFQALSFVEKSTKLSVLYPEERELKSRAMLYSTSTTREGLKGEAAYVGFGTPRDFETADVRGKIAVMRRVPDKDTWWDETSLASEKGATALLVVDSNPYIFTGTLETGFFANENRFREMIPRQIPCVGTTRDDGNYLIDLSKKTSVAVRLKVDAVIDNRSTGNVRGLIKGKKKAREKVLVTAHRDSSNTPGANDNGSGTVVLLELSRILTKQSPKRTIELVSLGAEEFFGQLGSLNYCKLHKEELRDIKALINIDMVAVGSEIKIITEGHWPDKTIRHTPWINRLLLRTAKELGYKAEYGTCLTGCSDEGRFIDAGVPSAWLWKPDDPYYHSMEDTADKVNANDLKAVADIVGSTVLQIANM
jgi:aminopeptidase YwaD